MKIKVTLANLVLMSIAAITVVSFSSCSDDLNLKDNQPQQAPEGADTALLEAYGLTFENFINDNDVIILDADTTQLSVSKAYADKMGIKTFVNHPMGIWHSMDQLPYIRKATAQQLQGDRYILTVVPATVAEIVGNKAVRLNTEIYVNPDANAVATRAADDNVPTYAAKYMDNEQVIHPAVVHLTDPYGYDRPYHTADEQPAACTRAASEGYEYLTADQLADGATRASARCRILSFKDELTKDFKFSCGSESSDTITVGFKAGLNFAINYFITLNGGVKWHVIIPEPYVEKFEAGVDGNFGLSSQITVGFKKEWKQTISKPLFSFSGYTFTFWVGPVPVCIKVDPNLTLSLDGSITGKMEMGLKYEYASTFKSGAGYQDGKGWYVIKEFEEKKNDLQFISPNVSVEADTGVGLYIGADVTIYGVVGPQLAVGPRLGAKASVTVSPFEDDVLDLKAKVGLTVNAVIGAKLKLLGYELASYSKTIELAGPWVLWQYPSDGTEHTTNESARRANWWKSVEPSWIARNTLYATKEQYVRTTLMKIRDIDEETARLEIRNLVMDKLEATYGNAFIDNVNMAIGALTDYILGPLQKEYDEWEYQQHAKAGDTEWVNAKNWDNICRMLSENYECAALNSRFDTVHEWFRNAFQREPNPSGDDLAWLADHIVNYDRYLSEHLAQIERDWEACAAMLTSHYSSLRQQDPDLFERALKETQYQFHAKYDAYPTASDSRLAPLFLQILNAAIAQKQAAEEQATATDWNNVSAILKSELAPYFSQYNKYSVRTLSRVRDWFKGTYQRDPSTSRDDIELMRTYFKDYMKQSYNVEI